MYRRNCCDWRTSASKSTDGANELLPGIVAGVVSAGVLLVAFGALALGVEAWWLAFPVGYGGVLPLSVGLARWRVGDGRRASRAGTTGGDASRSAVAQSAGVRSGAADEAALATLRRRYAEGEIDEVEFEQRVETLLCGDESQSSDR